MTDAGRIARGSALAVTALLWVAPVAAQGAAGEWTPFEGNPDAVCADGSAVDYLERIADPQRVVLYFEGGGACFSAATCDPDGADKAYTSSSDVTPEGLAERSGIFDTTHPQNPLAEHSFVYVPYCTGDVHLGNKRTAYGPDLTIEHRGFANGLIALDHVVEAFPEAEEVVVAGSSAGSVPTPLYAGLVADRYPEARIVVIADSSGAYPDDPALNGLIGSLWGSMAALPDWPETEGVTVRDWGIPSLYRYAGAHAPQIVFTKFDYAYDETQAFYGELVGVDANELLTLIDGIDAGVEAAGVELASYVAPGDAHTILGSPDFYELEVGGVRFADWIGELIDGGRPGDVHCGDCR